eukprot:7491-Heterococcus_DN1.PRE.2
MKLQLLACLAMASMAQAVVRQYFSKSNNDSALPIMFSFYAMWTTCGLDNAALSAANMSSAGGAMSCFGSLS